MVCGVDGLAGRCQVLLGVGLVSRLGMSHRARHVNVVMQNVAPLLRLVVNDRNAMIGRIQIPLVFPLLLLVVMVVVVAVLRILKRL